MPTQFTHTHLYMQSDNSSADEFADENFKTKFSQKWRIILEIMKWIITPIE